MRSLCFCCGRVRLTTELRHAYERKLRCLLAGDLEAALGTQTDAAVSRASVKRADAAGALAPAADGGQGAALQDGVALREQTREQTPLPSSIVAALQEALGGLFADIAKQTCPHCGCVQPKLKRAGKLAIIVQPLSAKQLAKNAANGAELRYVLCAEPQAV